MTHLRNYDGKRFGRLVVIKRLGKFGHHYKMLCRCDCGTEKAVWLTGLIGKQHTQSCGCLCRERAKEVHSLPRGEAAFNSLWATYRYLAKKRKLTFLLTKDEFRSLTLAPCTYCGISPANCIKSSSGNGRGNGSYTYNGVDRIDSEKGYESGNVQAACATCNRAKRQMTNEDFLSWVARVARHSLGMRTDQ